jgi:hypothetical protein
MYVLIANLCCPIAWVSRDLSAEVNVNQGIGLNNSNPCRSAFDPAGSGLNWQLVAAARIPPSTRPLMIDEIVVQPQ